uniref:N-acetyltransferase domain-containing protein n=1 Tax=Polysiphonia sertularioides TaxID=945028 RepID=A0A1Z1M989_9FLOR|nr:hypothetical protein [Polysiphonia sertularioides]ARW62391.1 hypothetical protein [Polysiphonia sertularioides]
MTFWKFFFNYHKSKTSDNKKIKKNKELCIREVNRERIYLSTCKNIDVEDLEKLCDSVGWVRRPLRKVKYALENSFLIVSIFLYKENKKQLIGFARVTSDGSFNATIWDVVVHPDFQGNGLGKLLMHAIIKELRTYDISTITLFADPEVIKFYKHIGFTIDPDGVKGMFWYPI